MVSSADLRNKEEGYMCREEQRARRAVTKKNSLILFSRPNVLVHTHTHTFLSAGSLKVSLSLSSFIPSFSRSRRVLSLSYRYERELTEAFLTPQRGYLLSFPSPSSLGQFHSPRNYNIGRRPNLSLPVHRAPRLKSLKGHHAYKMGQERLSPAVLQSSNDRTLSEKEDEEVDIFLGSKRRFCVKNAGHTEAECSNRAVFVVPINALREFGEERDGVGVEMHVSIKIAVTARRGEGQEQAWVKG